MTDRHTVQRLDLATATGLWRIEGASGTTYTIDVDEQLAIRQPAPGAPTGPYDGCWMHLISVVNLEEVDVVRHGLRHRWDLDPAPGQPGFTIWWIQSVVAAIVPVELTERPHGRVPSAFEDSHPFDR